MTFPSNLNCDTEIVREILLWALMIFDEIFDIGCGCQNCCQNSCQNELVSDEVVKMTTSIAAIDEYFVKIAFSLQRRTPYCDFILVIIEQKHKPWTNKATQRLYICQWSKKYRVVYCHYFADKTNVREFCNPHNDPQFLTSPTNTLGEMDVLGHFKMHFFR